jgi:hypothetical protein
MTSRCQPLDPRADLEVRVLLRLSILFGAYRLLVPLRYGHISPLMAPAKAMQERGHETIFFSVVGREHTITERSMGLVPYDFEEYSEGALTGIFDKIGRLKGVMPSHKMKWTNRASHGKGKIL